MQTPNSAIGAATQRLAIDAQALDALKLQARTDPEKAIRQAAQQFETVFLNILMKSMREATPKDGLFDSDTGNMYNSMLDQQWVEVMSKKGIGLAEVVVKQMERQFASKKINTSDGSTDNKIHSNFSKLPNPSAIQQPGAFPVNRIMEKTLSTLDRINKNTLQGVQQVNDAHSPARNFVQRLWSHAKQAEQTTGVPAQFMLGQAALESGWGKREIRHSDGTNSFNLFGIKAGRDWKGKVVESVTTEYVKGHPHKTVERFRAYASYAEAFSDYARLLSSNPRYAQTLAAAGQGAAQFAIQLQKAGYATDPQYAQKLTQTIEKTVRMIV